ncbi:hypothetical protein POM88_017436 [Heracleum sosnowskyi]|uniref:Uncharacterized protein n=1 Tax=Heracleum sosnowskyi TaxID=360622 RepID=A0AAD8IQB1_9APIA|nr:hypothetical protein POM88_017436 [Heracleum sosnowskyi]
MAVGDITNMEQSNLLQQKREHEVALVGAFKREKDKDMALQALTASNVAAMDLAKQREKEPGNQDVTKFAMENLRLKEDIRRLKLISEEGEWERMNEQIIILQNKLLDALDWKLMHESDPSTTQRNISEMVNDASNDCNLLASTKVNGLAMIYIIIKDDKVNTSNNII